ncbi:hypothetical protein [Bradyrhizobium japonicum]|uniref:hypothetical protein n=1 Tax=Bradyrhizobium japonicum TaxID=375 RepID=UPI0027152534|nr:hypothetical protein [Bradyrhizobium japonicum]WLB24123.1 hypothetical protein QIH95_50315 [Bradyrhizobium japonicum]
MSPSRGSHLQTQERLVSKQVASEVQYGEKPAMKVAKIALIAVASALGATMNGKQFIRHEA